MLPSILIIHIGHGSGRQFRLWLPLFLVWIIVLACLIVVSPLLLIAQMILTLTDTGIDLINIFYGVYELAGELKGLHVNVESPRRNSKILITIN